MKSAFAATITGACVAAVVGAGLASHTRLHAASVPARIPPDGLTAIVQGTCATCHNADTKAGDLDLETFDVAQAAAHADVAEKMIGKLRAGMMPPPGFGGPGGDTLTQLAAALEDIVDRAAGSRPDPGTRTFQRLNRPEYERSIHDLLALDVDAGEWLPLDTKSANFDNIADVQTPSATALDGYLDAASQISRLAVGDPKAGISSSTYKIPRLTSQWHHVEGAPIGTRGGISVIHNFPANGEYVFSVQLHTTATGELYGSSAPYDENIEISVNGARVALLPIDRGMAESDPGGVEIKTPPIPVNAGPQRISAAFVRIIEGPLNDILAPVDNSIADPEIGHQYAITSLAQMRMFTIRGPFNPTGVSETPSRKKIFSCRPLSAAEARPCAEQILTRLATEAYRRPATPDDVTPLMTFYDQAAKDDGFEGGIRMALEALLSSPYFIFRIEEPPHGAQPGQQYAISDVDLASRLAFFLWATPPDSELMTLAERGKLSKPDVLEAQTKRMLADPRADALGTRFAAQWFRLQDIDKILPTAANYPDFSTQLTADMKEETERFFMSLVRDNRSVLDLISADYTFVNDRLAEHYGMTGVTGPEFRRVQYQDDRRRGVLGQASILTLTSHANRTSPVLRGKWVLEVLLGSAPPPPPPNVPDLEKTAEAKDGRALTTRERMEMHRDNPACRSCHTVIDPIGLALDNFDVTGGWRIRENGSSVDTRGQLYDGTPVSNLMELERALLKRPIPLVRTFTLNLMAYATGRRMEYTDGPAIRKIARDAEGNGYRMQDFILGVVKSDAFRMKRVPTAAAEQ
jgi:hypothetical protein